jgi:hypothetical protein
MHDTTAAQPTRSSANLSLMGSPFFQVTSATHCCPSAHAGGAPERLMLTTCTHTRARTHTHAHHISHTSTYTHARTHTHAHHIYRYLHAHTHARTRTHAHARTHTHARTHAHTHTHTHTSSTLAPELTSSCATRLPTKPFPPNTTTLVPVGVGPRVAMCNCAGAKRAAA